MAGDDRQPLGWKASVLLLKELNSANSKLEKAPEPQLRSKSWPIA